MKMLLAALLIGLVFFERVDGQTNSVRPAETNGPTVETVVCIRHGEKPPGGLGQLTCQGLNRALALPEVLLGKFGKPQYIFAPNPTQKVDVTTKQDGYYYVRPLATIEPTAIRCGLPVNTQFGYREIKGLETELQDQKYQNATVFVAWEYGQLNEFAKNIIKDNGGDLTQAPVWTNAEYDIICVFKIVAENGRKTFSLTVDHEGLNGLSATCP